MRSVKSSGTSGKAERRTQKLMCRLRWSALASTIGQDSETGVCRIMLGSTEVKKEFSGTLRRARAGFKCEASEAA